MTRIKNIPNELAARITPSVHWVEPLAALAIPGVVNKDEIWGELTTRGILLDRLRLVESCSDTPSEIPLENIDYIRNLVLEIPELVH